MKKLAKTAKKLDAAAKVIFWMLIIFGGIMIASSLFIVFFGQNILNDVTHSVKLGMITFEIADQYAPDASMLRLQYIIGAAVIAVSAAITCLGIRFIRNILEPMKNERPFDGSVYKNIKKLAWLVLVGGAAVTLLGAAGTAAMAAAYDFTSIFSNDAIANISAEITFDGTSIVIFALLYLLAYVFQYGEKLQTESDETL